jgi:serine/threonine protein kinase
VTEAAAQLRPLQDGRTVDCILCGVEFEAHDGPCPQCGWNPDSVHDPKSLRAGELIRGRYEVVSNLGVGRLGAAFLVSDTEAGTDAVLKIVHPGLVGNEEVGRRFLAGVRALRKITHPCMVRVLDAGATAEDYYVVNEFVDGVPLRELMGKRKNQGKGFQIREMRPVLQQIAGFFRESGVAEHGALSPENIWIQPDGLKILDVGWATNLPPAAVGYRLSSRGNARGYVAPELLGGASPTPRSDVYSLGVLIGEMFTQATFAGRPEVFSLAAPDLPADLEALIRRALSPDPGARFASSLDLETAMEALGDAASRVAPPSADGGSAPRTLPKIRAAEPMSRFRTTIGPPSPPPPENTVQILMEDVIREHLEDGDEPAREPSQPSGRSIPWAKIASTGAGGQDGAPRLERSPLITPKRPGRKDSLPPQPVRLAPPPKRDVTQEIDLGDVGDAEEIARLREGTQEIDLALIEEHVPKNAVDAVVKLEQQAEDAVRSSTEELIRRADRLEGVDPRLVRAAHKLEAERRGSRSAKAAEILKERAETLDGIDPRLLRAAARLEEAKVNDVPETAKEPGSQESDDWRERISGTKEDSVVSFLASPIVEPSGEVRGFPLTQHRRPQNRPPAKPPTPVPPQAAPPPRSKRGNRGGESLARALYDEDGETDDQSQPTILVHPARLPRTVQRVAIDRRLLYMEMALPVMAGLLFAGMIILLAVAASLR